MYSLFLADALTSVAGTKIWCFSNQIQLLSNLYIFIQVKAVQ